MKSVLFCFALFFSAFLTASQELIESAKTRDIGDVRARINAKEDVNFSDSEGKTALLYAAENGHMDLVRLLLENDAAVNHADNMENTALMLASGNGHADVVNLLLTFGAKKNNANKAGATALSKAMTALARPQNPHKPATGDYAKVIRLLFQGNPTYAPLYEETLTKHFKASPQRYLNAFSELPAMISGAIERAMGNKQTMPKPVSQIIVSFIDAEDNLKLISFTPDPDGEQVTIHAPAASGKVNPIMKGLKKGFKNLFGN